jgi:hypothetical protein
LKIGTLVPSSSEGFKGRAEFLAGETLVIYNMMSDDNLHFFRQIGFLELDKINHPGL